MPFRVKKYAIKLLLLLMHLLKGLGKILLVSAYYLVLPLKLIWSGGLRWVVFLIYKRLLRFKISSVRAGRMAKRTIFSIFGHRYVVHGMIALIVIFVSAENLYAREVDLGERSRQSLVFQLVKSPEDIEFIEYRDIEEESYLDFTFVGLVDSSTSTQEGPLLGTDAGLLTYDQSGVLTPLSLSPEDAVSEKILISKPESYIVQSGDTIGEIAQRYGISINTILWANSMTARSVIRPGQELTILPVTGIIHKVKRGETLGAIAKKYGTEVDKILTANRVASVSLIQIGEELIIPGGKPPVVRRRVSPIRLGSVKNVFSSSAVPSSRTAETGKLVWPTDSRKINQGFWWKHPAIDLHGRSYNAIYAIDDGTVISSGWNRSGYGNMILIDHGNGTKSRYAHNSKHFVKAGDQVTKGQTIAMLGNTGRSTGPHLHFELYINNRRVNPLNYY